jgi:hypothetical protein
MSAADWVGAVAGAAGAVFALLAWLESRSRPEWTLQPTRDPTLWLLTRTGRRTARILEMRNVEGAEPTFMDSRAQDDVRSFPAARSLVVHLEQVWADTQLDLRYRTWPWRRDRYWSTPLY